MGPIDGVVLNEHQIELRNGTIVNINHTFRIGAAVLVRWDFTENRPRRVEYKKHVYPGMSLEPRGNMPDPDEAEEAGRLDHDIIDEICRHDCVS